MLVPAQGGGTENYMIFTKAAAVWKESKGFLFNRVCSDKEYVFIQFHTPVEAYLGGEKVNIESGGCVVWNHNSKRKFKSPDCELVHDWFHAEGDYTEFFQKIGIEFEKVYYPQYVDEISRLVSEIEIENVKKDVFCDVFSNLAAEKIFAIMARSQYMSEPNALNLKQREEFLRARTIIHTDYLRNWGADEMAALVNLSRSRFFCLYKELFGITPHLDLCRIRIQRAKRMLKNDNASVEETAEKCGYTNQYHFIRQFKKTVGVTPGKYKAMH